MSRVCTDIPIFDDMLVENSEEFVVSLVSTNNRVIIGLDTASVTVQDNDG